jgi:hypothetical protein
MQAQGPAWFDLVLCGAGLCRAAVMLRETQTPDARAEAPSLAPAPLGGGRRLARVPPPDGFPNEPLQGGSLVQLVVDFSRDTGISFYLPVLPDEHQCPGDRVVAHLPYPNRLFGLSGHGGGCGLQR